MVVQLVLLSVALTSVGLLLVLLVAFGRHLKVLAGSVRAFKAELDPFLLGLSGGTTETRERLERLAERSESLGSASRRGRSGRGRGGRIRR